MWHREFHGVIINKCIGKRHSGSAEKVEECYAVLIRDNISPTLQVPELLRRNIHT